MTINEVDDMLAYILKLYPKFEMPSEEGVKIWQYSLRGISKVNAHKAIIEHYTNSRYYPHLSDILNQIKKTRKEELPSPHEAWGQVMDYIQSPADSKPELHEAVKKSISSFGGIEVIQQSSANFIKREFEKVYELEIIGYIETGDMALPEPKKVIDYGALALERLKKEEEDES